MTQSPVLREALPYAEVTIIGTVLQVRIPLSGTDSAVAAQLNAEMRNAKGNRWIEARLKALGKSKKGLAEHLDVQKSRISEILKGDRRVHTTEVPLMAEYLEMSEQEIVGLVANTALRGSTIPLVGYIGGGAEIVPIDDHALGGGIAEVDAPPIGDDVLVAVKVRGDSMWPAYKEGDLIYYRRDAPFIEEQCLRKECVVQVRGGATMVKTVTRGSEPARYTLTSYNAPPIENAEIEWGAPVVWVKRE